MTDSSCLMKLISQIQPTEVYHLAAQSHVKVGVFLAHLMNSFHKIVVNLIAKVW